MINGTPSFGKFRQLPKDLRILIWEFSEQHVQQRYIEVIFQNKTMPDDPDKDNGCAYVNNPLEIVADLPKGLWVCRESRHFLLPRYPFLDLGAYCKVQSRETEFVWLEHEDPKRANEYENIRGIRFKPDSDIMVLQAGYALYKTTNFFQQLGERQKRIRTSRDVSPEFDASVQHLATSMLCWDKKPGLPNRQGMVMEGFPKLKTLCVIGQGNDQCGCGYCQESKDFDANKVQREVTNTIKALEPVREGKQNVPEIHAMPMDHEKAPGGRKPWWHPLLGLGCIRR